MSVTSSSPVHGTNNGLKESDLYLWKHPLKTFFYAFLEGIHLLRRLIISIKKNIIYTIVFLSIIASYGVFRRTAGPHSSFLESFEKQSLWCLYWIGLGVLSSIGLGSGLHTFLLYLGPHIASVTLAANLCKSLDFPSPPYPDEIVCPPETSDSPESISILNIMSKVRVEAFMWGAGTALGELPPYFVARASRLSGQWRESEAQEESSANRFARIIQSVVEKAGFFGILACASIPNPLFDLAGITCGHFLVPFWTFFGATLIGKAIIKMMIQKLFVIVAFHETHFETFVSSIGSLPVIGKYLDTPFREFLRKQKDALHRDPLKAVAGVKPQSWISWMFEKFVILMIIYFVISIVNSMAQNCLTRIKEEEKKSKKSKSKSKSNGQSVGDNRNGSKKSKKNV